jgi:plastocyanin
MKQLAIVVSMLLTACGDDGGTGTPPVDSGGSNMDAAMAAKVVAVTCPATPAATVMTTNAVDAFMPMNTTISVGGVVRFVMSTNHNLEPNPIAAMSDPATRVDYGETKCLRFDAAGTYGIYCAAHSFAGTITVQ